MKFFERAGAWPAGAALWCANLLAALPVQAQWNVPPGAVVQLGGGTARLGCTDLQLGGNLVLDGGAVSAARNVQVASAAQLQVGAGSVQLAQQWTNQGVVSVTSGTVTRAASAGCPMVGQAGAVQVTTPVPVTVPLPGGNGSAQVLVNGPGACAVVPGSVQISAGAPALPANASAPLGTVRFTATGCAGATVQVQVTYPRGSLAGLSVRKYGPVGQPARTDWFVPPGFNLQSGPGGDVVTYTVADNGDGDGDPTVGTIRDPMAPLLLPGAGGLQAVPGLGPWALLGLAGLMGLLGGLPLRRRIAR